uniref:Uncharacterized protein n=1 Tax=Biomphalaria glabrata TaxID=6526 RepID=A0A2C9LH83_BIOGL
MFADFLHEINPVDLQEWKVRRIFGKIYEIFKSPLVLLLKLTVPVVSEGPEDGQDEMRNWNKLLNCVHVFTAPVCAMFTTGVGFTKIGSVFPVYGLVMIISAVLFVAVYVTSKRDHRPVYHTVSFVMLVGNFE